MIFDYDECQRLMDSFNNTLIREVVPIGYTCNEKLPIRHFVLGSGKKNIVVLGGQHSNEIITVTFVLSLMKYLIRNNVEFENLTLHFIPMLNPEGYLVEMSAIRSVLSRNATDDEVVKFSYDYYKKYREDFFSGNSPVKKHQLLFNDVDYNSIDAKYFVLRDKVFDILSLQPRGSIIDWASNGNGVDLNSNTKDKIVSPFEFNRQTVYNNIRIDIPSPIGHPGNSKDANFTSEIEVLSLQKLMEEIKDSCFGLLNYHSIGGIIYQRPECDNKFITIYNYLLSKYYQEYTVKNDGTYDIVMDSSGKAISVNDHLRVLYPGNILIELSPMSGNPIGPFGDVKNYNATIQSNISSFMYLMSNVDKILSQSRLLVDEVSSYEEIDDFYDKNKRSH